MGAWSGEPFGNDTAADFAWDLDDANDWSMVAEALDEVLTDDEYLDADVAIIGIAAAEVVAHGLGRPTQSDAYTESVESFVARVPAPDAELVAKAARAVTSATSADGELAELWDGDEEWLNANAALLTALSGS